MMKPEKPRNVDVDFDSDSDLQHFGPNVRELRTKRHMHLKDLAEKAGISRNYMSEIETGYRIPAVKTARKIACALGVTPGYLLQDKIELLEVEAMLEDKSGPPDRLESFSPEDLKFFGEYAMLTHTVRAKVRQMVGLLLSSE